ncbi:MAG: hypothetical protein LBV43_10745 [Prevotella sp.]|nr:hypothetical protein [Prevotella sp.]
MATTKSNDYLSYGITFLLYGVFLLLDKVGIIHKIPYGGQITSSGAFFLIAAIIFLITQPNRLLSWIFLIIAILLNAGIFLSWTTIYFYLIAPVGLIIIGVVMLLISKKN